MSDARKLQERMAAAAQLLTAKGPKAAMAAIQQALAKGVGNAGGAGKPPSNLASGQPEFVSKLLSQLGVSLPGAGAAVDASARGASVTPAGDAGPRTGQFAGQAAGQFLGKSYSGPNGSRRYKLYIPASYAGQAMPLMVMLHGCTQDPDDFAAGTQMNAVAEEKQCFVVYPAQDSASNAHKCWNWFKAIDQQRGQGEPGIIAGITNAVIDEYGLDRGKVYVAGLSAGGAMAAIMGATYPDLYHAVGVHSGLPYAAAQDLPSAMSAMRGAARRQAGHVAGASKALSAIPVIVFHGDKDRTVSAINGDQVIEDVVRGFRRQQADAQMHVLVEEGGGKGQRSFTRTSHHVDDQPVLAEHWVIHGAGHAWAGGSAHGSYTDASGPDASREMLRFFYTQSRT